MAAQLAAADAMIASGRPDKAEQMLLQFLRGAPRNPDLLAKLGMAAGLAGGNERAIDYLKRAVAARPDFVWATSNLGVAYQRAGQSGAAVEHIARALELAPDNTEIREKLIQVLYGMGRFGDAVNVAAGYGGEMAINVSCDILRTMIERGDAQAALDHLGPLVRANPEVSRLHLQTGGALHRLGRNDEAAAAYERALALDPESPAANFNLAEVQRERGFTAQAQHSLARAAECAAAAGLPADAAWLQRALVLPIIYSSTDHVLASREAFRQGLVETRARGLSIPDPCRSAVGTSFFLAYQGLDDRDLQEEVVRLRLATSPRLNWAAPRLRQDPVPVPDGRIKVGVISEFLRGHTIGKLNRGFIAHLDRSRFHVTLIRQPATADQASRAIEAAADDVVVLPLELAAMQERVAQLDLDVAFYPDIGMSRWASLLAYARLAPVQCVTWGHPVTTGIPAVDYFLSSDSLEPPGAEASYSERLIRFDTLPTYYYRPLATRPEPDRARLGLPEDATLYVCPQSLFKFHPIADRAWADLLTRDPKGRLILIAGLHETWDRLLMARFHRTYPHLSNRVLFVPRMSLDSFLVLLATADVVLDPPHFGGGNTTYEAFSVGIPIVTWPGPFMRGRVTYACYRKMDLMECVADDAPHWVEMAVRIANDKTYRAELSARIVERSGALFEDMEAVRELERFFEAAVAAASRGEKVTSWPPTHPQGEL